MAMFSWNCLSSSFTGGLCAKGAASPFSMILAGFKVHRAACLLLGRNVENEHFSNEKQ